MDFGNYNFDSNISPGGEEENGRLIVRDENVADK